MGGVLSGFRGLDGTSVLLAVESWAGRPAPATYLMTKYLTGELTSKEKGKNISARGDLLLNVAMEGGGRREEGMLLVVVGESLVCPD